MSDPIKQLATPAATWRANGEPDPHGTQYDCERAGLAYGNMTDDELANAVFMHDHRNFDIAAAQRGEPTSVALLQAAKDRIRWLSRKLAEATTAFSPNVGEVGQRDAVIEECARICDDSVDQVHANGWTDAANERKRCAAAIRDLHRGEAGTPIALEAPIGYKAPWTDADRQRLDRAVVDVFGKQAPTSEAVGHVAEIIAHDTACNVWWTKTPDQLPIGTKLCIAGDRQEDLYVIDRLGGLLADIACALWPDLTLEQHHAQFKDMPALAQKLLLELELYRADAAQRKAELSLPAATDAPALTDAQTRIFHGAIRDALGEAFDCTRTWSAWGTGTMTENDFDVVADDPARVAEIAEAAIKGLAKAQAAGSTL